MNVLTRESISARCRDAYFAYQLMIWRDMPKNEKGVFDEQNGNGKRK